MSKFLNVFAPALGGTAVVLGGAYILADQFVTDIPAPLRGQAVPAASAQQSEAPESTQEAEEPAAVARSETTDAPPATEQPAEDAQTPAAQSPTRTTAFNLGRPATEEEIAAWDVKVMPDGTGLPPGSGSVTDGEALFSESCAVCHGEFAEGAGNWPKLAGGDGSLADQDPVKTVGSYWPYLSTAWDYVHRSMPFGAAQTLSDDDTYAIVAYILYSNFIVEEDFVLTQDNFLEVEMPNADGFIIDDRAETEYPDWRREPCMEDCKENVEITMRATVLDVTPEEPDAAAGEATGQEGARSDASAEDASAEAPAAEETTADEAPAEDAAAEAPTQEAAAQPAAPDPELVAAGEKVFRKCKACHQVGEGASSRTGPQLNGVMGRSAGGLEDFRYSKAMKEAGENGLVWTDETLADFLADPKGYMKGTKMSFRGLKKESDLAAIGAYLHSFEE